MLRPVSRLFLLIRSGANRLRRPRRVLYCLLIASVLLPSGLLVVLEVLVHASLWKFCPAGGRGLMLQVLREPLPVTSAQLRPPPYSKTTLDALQDFLDKIRAAEAAGGGAVLAYERLWDADTAAEQFAERREIDPSGTASISYAQQCFRESFQAFTLLIEQPDFDSDMDLLRSGGDIGIYTRYFLRVYHAPTTASEVREKAELALKAYESFRGAVGRSSFHRWGCEMGARNALDSLVASCRVSGDSEFAHSLMQQLELVPPPLRPVPPPIQQVRNWAFEYHIARYRELHRTGQSPPLPANPTGLELTWALQQASPVLMEEFGHPESKFLRFLYVRDLGPWTSRVWELHYILSNEWAFDHTFPMAGTPAYSLNTPAVDMLRVTYDRARLNLAAMLFRAETSTWPLKPEDLVPKYLPALPPDPGLRGPYLWSPARCDFDLRNPPDEKVGII